MASGTSDRVKGRVKAAAGVLTGDEELERQGKADQSAGKLEQHVEKVMQKSEKVIDNVKDALSWVQVGMGPEIASCTAVGVVRWWR